MNLLVNWFFFLFLHYALAIGFHDFLDVPSIHSIVLTAGFQFIILRIFRQFIKKTSNSEQVLKNNNIYMGFVIANMIFLYFLRGSIGLI